MSHVKLVEICGDITLSNGTDCENPLYVLDCSPHVEVREVCVNGEELFLYISRDKATLEITNVRFETLDGLVVPGLTISDVTKCGCPQLPLANVEWQPYGSGIFGIQFNNNSPGGTKLSDTTAYDNIANDAGCPTGGPRNVWFELVNFTYDSNIISSNLLLGPYSVGVGQEQAVVDDINAITAPYNITFTYGPSDNNAYGLVANFPDSVDWGLVFKDYFDDGSGGLCDGNQLWTVRSIAGTYEDGFGYSNTLTDPFDAGWQSIIQGVQI